MVELRIGTCSWKYPSWEGLVYSAPKGINYLYEYAQRYNTVEIDQWFWSLFDRGEPVLPRATDVNRYRASVESSFRFSVKVPNSVTLTHYYRKTKQDPLIENPHFLSDSLFQSFLDRLNPIKELLGPLMFQFEYLNKMKMPSQMDFQRRFSRFLDQIPDDYCYAMEIRNPNYLNEKYFEFLKEHRLYPVLLQGYYMPSILQVFSRLEDAISNHDLLVIRLHGPDRSQIEKKSRSIWNRLYDPRDDELAGISEMIRKLQEGSDSVYVNVNNHYEGSSPLTIDRLRNLFQLVPSPEPQGLSSYMGGDDTGQV